MGYQYDSAYLVRVSHDGGVTWRNSDTFVYDANAVRGPTAITADATGDILVIGDQWHWIVRKLAAGLPPPPPSLSTSFSGTTLSVSWPATATSFVLQSATTLANGGDWQNANLTPTETNGQKVVSVSTTNARGFFRFRGL